MYYNARLSKISTSATFDKIQNAHDEKENENAYTVWFTDVTAEVVFTVSEDYFHHINCIASAKLFYIKHNQPTGNTRRQPSSLSKITHKHSPLSYFTHCSLYSTILFIFYLIFCTYVTQSIEFINSNKHFNKQ